VRVKDLQTQPSSSPLLSLSPSQPPLPLSQSPSLSTPSSSSSDEPP